MNKITFVDYCKQYDQAQKDLDHWKEKLTSGDVSPKIMAQAETSINNVGRTLVHAKKRLLETAATASEDERTQGLEIISPYLKKEDAPCLLK